MSFVLCGPISSAGNGFYFIGYADMVSGYHHAYRTEDRRGRVEVVTTRSSVHPSDSRCPGCVEGRCPSCGDSTHPSVPRCGCAA